jgi:hypothetical protein
VLFNRTVIYCIYGAGSADGKSGNRSGEQVFFSDGSVFTPEAMIETTPNTWIYENYVVISGQEIVAYFDGIWNRPLDITSSFGLTVFDKTKPYTVCQSVVEKKCQISFCITVRFMLLSLLVPTFIAGLMIYELAGVIVFVPLTCFSVHYIVLCILSYSYICFFIYRCLTIQNNTVVLKEKGIWLFLLVVSVIIGIFCLLFREKTMTACTSFGTKLAEITSKDNPPSYKVFFIIYIFSPVLIAPLCEELVGRELVFKLIVKAKSKKIVFALFIVFALIISLLHLNKKVLYLFMRWGLFTVLFSCGTGSGRTGRCSTACVYILCGMQ